MHEEDVAVIKYIPGRPRAGCVCLPMSSCMYAAASGAGMARGLSARAVPAPQQPPGPAADGPRTGYLTTSRACGGDSAWRPAVGMVGSGGRQQRGGVAGSTPHHPLSRHHHHNSRPIKRSTYKHVPHREKPPHMVARRNARERRRVQAVNNAFVRLRRHIPYENKNKRLSKVKTLRIAIDYIQHMQGLIADYDSKHPATVAPPYCGPPGGAVGGTQARHAEASKENTWCSMRINYVGNQGFFRP